MNNPPTNIVHFPEPAQKLQTLGTLVALFDRRDLLRQLDEDERALVMCAAEAESELVIESILREYAIAMLALAIKYKLVRQP